MDRNIKRERQEEIDNIYKTLQNAMKKEGYEICYWKYADKGYKAFKIPLKSKVINDEKLTIKIEFNYFD